MGKMHKWSVSGTVTISVTMTVEAESEDDAIEVAQQEWPGLSDYCGNGRSGGALVGVTDSRVHLDAGDDCPDFNNVEPA